MAKGDERDIKYHDEDPREMPGLKGILSYEAVIVKGAGLRGRTRRRQAGQSAFETGRQSVRALLL